MIYWDEGNGKVTNDKSFALIYDSEWCYIETYEIENGKRIDIAYSQKTKEIENMYYYRLRVLRSYGLEYCDLGKLIKLGVPTEQYKELLRRWKNDNRRRN